MTFQKEILYILLHISTNKYKQTLNVMLILQKIYQFDIFIYNQYRNLEILTKNLCLSFEKLRSSSNNYYSNTLKISILVIICNTQIVS
mgnify:CR=1 FL=1